MKPGSYYHSIRLKRIRRSRRPNAKTMWYQVQQRRDTTWVALGSFATEDAALAFLEDRVEVMVLLDQMQEEGEYE